MSLTASDAPVRTTPHTHPWRGFLGAGWRDTIDTRSFIQANYTPYQGDSAFLCGPTERTRGLWGRLTEMFPTERANGVHDIDTHTPSSITSHGPGYIDRDREIIVGLQTDAPLKRAMMPNGGWRMVKAALDALGYESDPAVE